VSPPLDRGRALLVGRIVARALAAGGAAALRELAAERERRRSESLVTEAAPAVAVVRQGGGQLMARCVYGLFVLALVCLTLVALNVDLLLPAGWRAFFRVVCGGILVLEGLPLAAGKTLAEATIGAAATAGLVVPTTRPAPASRRRGHARRRDLRTRPRDSTTHLDPRVASTGSTTTPR
jgi:hypothetical protein